VTIRRQVLKMMSRLEDRADDLRYRLRRRLGRGRPVEIVPYRGYGRRGRIWIKGRVLEDRNVPPARLDDSAWDNLRSMLRRARTNEIPEALVRVRFRGHEQLARANREGYFELCLNLQDEGAANGLWRTVELELVEPELPGRSPVYATGEVEWPSETARFGIISDIDDTVIHTHAHHWLPMARTVLLGNAYTRLPFPGVAAFYRALQRGFTTYPGNPLFYVSNGPWNLYDLVNEFLVLNDIPVGPVIMRDWGLTEEGLWPFRPRGHKLEAIRRILEFYSDLPFILVGDSGEKDPEIYREVVALYPGRIWAVYIRAVGDHRSPLDKRGEERIRALEALAQDVAHAGSRLVLGETTLPLAEHAAQQGWISADAVDEIRVEVVAGE